MGLNSPDIQTWRDLESGLWDKLTGRGAETTYKFQNMEVQVPSSTSETAPQIKWKISGAVKIRIKDDSTATKP